MGRLTGSLLLFMFLNLPAIGPKSAFESRLDQVITRYGGTEFHSSANEIKGTLHLEGARTVPFTLSFKDGGCRLERFHQEGQVSVVRRGKRGRSSRAGRWSTPNFAPLQTSPQNAVPGAVLMTLAADPQFSGKLFTTPEGFNGLLFEELPPPGTEDRWFGPLVSAAFVVDEEDRIVSLTYSDNQDRMRPMHYAYEYSGKDNDPFLQPRLIAMTLGSDEMSEIHVAQMRARVSLPPDTFDLKEKGGGE